MRVGDIITWERTFTEEEIRLFGRLTGDEGVQHIQTDNEGRLMARGLFTATLPTKIGGDLNFIVRDMTFQFLRPVYAGDTIECKVIITDLQEEGGVRNVSSKWVCCNQRGKEVMNGSAKGIIRH